MSQTKFIMSSGLAFSEEKDMDRLRRQSLKGWHVDGFQFMGYSLKKGESKDYIYSLDYRTLASAEENEYFEFFSSAGWSHVASNGDMHLFRAEPGTKPIYSDQETKVEKYTRANKWVIGLTIPLVLITALLWVGMVFTEDTLKTILFVAAAIFTIFAVPITWTAFASTGYVMKARGRKGVGSLLKWLPIIVVVGVVITLFIIYPSIVNNRILLSALIGGISGVVIVWVLGSIFNKIRG